MNNDSLDGHIMLEGEINIYAIRRVETRFIWRRERERTLFFWVQIINNVQSTYDDKQNTIIIVDRIEWTYFLHILITVPYSKLATVLWSKYCNQKVRWTLNAKQRLDGLKK